MTPRRRIGSDEARSWARRLPLNDALAKGLMAAVCCYVGDTGIATVSLETLSEDSDQSIATVRRRLRWLEDLGVLSLLPRWIDADGRVNYEGRGRQVCSDIRLNLDVDLFDVAMRTGADKKARQPEGDGPDEIRGSQQQPLNPDAGGIRQQPLNPVRGVSVGVPLESPPIGSESSSEEIPTPKPPSVPEASSAPQQAPAAAEAPQAGIQGEQAKPPDREPEGFDQLIRDYDRPALVNRAKALAEFVKLSETDRRKAREVMPRYAADCTRLRKPPKKLHLWLRDRDFANYVGAAGGSRFVAASSDEGAAVRVIWALAGLRPPTSDHSGVQGYWCRFDLTPQVLALGHAPLPRGISPPPPCWPEFDAGRAQHVRWQEIVQKAIGRGVQVTRGKIRAPWPWPPRIDGSRSDEPQQSATGPPPLQEISEAEALVFASELK